MEAFPFPDGEWEAVKEAALPVVNAGLAGDDVLRASRLPALLDLLAGLRARHGDHPVLLETQADFAEDDLARVALYRRAADVAAANGLPTFSIRVSLARVLLDDGDSEAAMVDLLACEGELGDVDERDRADWAELVAEAGTPGLAFFARRPGRTPRALS